MTVINAQSIINTLQAAALVAPMERDQLTMEAMPAWSQFQNRYPWGFDGDIEHAEIITNEDTEHGYSRAGDKAEKQANEYGRELVASACAEIRALLNVPNKIKVQTSARGYFILQNTKDKLQAMAATVRSKAAAFGGGLTKAPRAQKPSIVYAAGAVKMARELMQDHDHAGALELAESKAGALFYKHTKQAFMILAPIPCEEIEGFHSGMTEQGEYIVFGVASGIAINRVYGARAAKTRAKGIENAKQTWQEYTPEKQEAGRARCAQNPCDQTTARAAWMTEHGITTSEEITERIETQQEQESEAMEASEQASEAAASTWPAFIPAALPMAPARAPVVLLNGTIVLHRRMENGAQEAYIESGRAMTNAEYFDYCNQTKPAASEAAARGVAAVVASAAAGAAIEQASEAAALGEVASVEQARDLAHMECEARDLVTTCEAGAMGGNTSTSAPNVGHVSSTSTPAPARAAQSGQLIAGKSGHWSARFYLNDAGAPCMAFTGPDGAQENAQEFSTGRARMAALQAMARLADDIAAGYCDDDCEETTPGFIFPPASREVQNLGDFFNGLQDGALFVLERGGEVFIKSGAGFRSGRGGALFTIEPWRQVLTCDACGVVNSEQASAHGVCATQAPHPTQYPADTGADYTDTRKTSAPDYTTPRETSGALHIRMEQAEGYEGEFGRVITAGSFADADSQLMTWAETAPKTGGYYKCDFVITWPNGSTYSGRYDLKHHTLEKPSLTAHMVDGAEFYTGKNCPLHMDAAAYKNYTESVSEETRETYAEVLATMATLGAYTPKARPVAIDLRAVIAGGVPMSALIGAGVVYTGDIANQPSTGAIVSAEPCTWAGVRVVVQTEDGEVHHVTASQFGDKAGDRYRFDWKMHGAPYLAQLAAAVAAKHAQASSAKQIAKEKHARDLVELTAKFPQLKQRDSKQCANAKLAAINARILLKEAFKGVKFSVTSERSSLTVRWTDGPTDAAVDAIIGQFDIGASDTQSDYFYTVSTAWSELFGGAQYFNTYRDMSDAAIEEIIASEWPADGGDPRPSLEDWRKGRGAFGWDNENYWSRDRMHQAINQWTGPAK